MKQFSFRYGSGSVNIELDEANILGVLSGKPTPPIADIPSALSEAVERPIGSAPLKDFICPGDRICLIISDMSRFWMRQDKVIPPLLRYLYTRCGVKAEQITILVANGTHAPGNEEDLRTLVTNAVYDTVRVVNHDCLADDLVYLGTTPHETPVWIHPAAANADKVICLGACVHHVMAGFGGGRKSILPGISGMETIKHNHAYSLDERAFRSNPRIGNGKLEDNPLHQDMCEAAGMVKNLFMINLVMNAEMQLAYIFAGHYMESWLRACEQADAVYRTLVPCKADAVIASCGGYPKDMSLYQGTKSIDNVETALKPGGTLILLIEAREGGGPPEYFDWISSLLDGTMEDRLRSRFTIPGYIFFLNCEQARRYRILMLTSIPPETLAPMGIRAFSDLSALLREANLTDKKMYVIPNASTVIPEVRQEE
ncbi:MAG: nickel-dependent lactate racemase [Clostridia bacterium]|nr:nickel-dependent lactate racemase [Clostridia bacterium]